MNDSSIILLENVNKDLKLSTTFMSLPKLTKDSDSLSDSKL